MTENHKLTAKNSCIKCKFEKTCGYSPLAMLGKRTDESIKPCCLRMKSNNAGPFFEPKQAKLKRKPTTPIKEEAAA